MISLETFSIIIIEKMRLTLLLVLINVGVFAYTFLNLPYFIETYGISSDSLAKGKYTNIVTAMFIHNGILHLLGNMLVLFFVGRTIEKYTNTVEYLTVYFLSGILPNLSIPLFNFIVGDITGVGASAAISGLIGFGAFRLSGKWVLSPIRFIPIPMPFLLAGALYTFLNLAGVFIIKENINIAAGAHLFGGIIGALFGLVGEKHKLRKIVIFLLLIAFISLLPYLIKFLL